MKKKRQLGRRDFLRGTAAFAITGATLHVAVPKAGTTVWQLDPMKCLKCGKCATNCVLNPSAVKCINSYDICGYCDLCGGYLQVEAKQRDTGAENQLCPTAAIERKFIESPYYSYDIIEDLCIGCAKCVEACEVFGNGSFYLQVNHDICVNCNECSIAAGCPAEAFSRVPREKPYMLKTKESEEKKQA